MLTDKQIVEETLYELFLAAKTLPINPREKFFPQFMDYAETQDLEDNHVITVLGIIQDLAEDIYNQKTPTIRNSHRETVVKLIHNLKQELRQ